MTIIAAFLLLYSVFVLVVKSGWAGSAESSLRSPPRLQPRRVTRRVTRPLARSFPTSTFTPTITRTPLPTATASIGSVSALMSGCFNVGAEPVAYLFDDDLSTGVYCKGGQSGFQGWVVDLNRYAKITSLDIWFGQDGSGLLIYMGGDYSTSKYLGGMGFKPNDFTPSQHQPSR